MSSFSFYEATVPHARGALNTLLELTDKLEAHAKSASVSTESLLEAKLADDMLPFTFQVHVVCDAVSKMVARILGVEPADSPSFKDIKTPDDVRARVKTVLSTLEQIDQAKFNERFDAPVTFGLGVGKSGQAKAYGYANGYSLPNIYFHVTTAYAILRKEGVQIGKSNYQPNYLNPYLL